MLSVLFPQWSAGLFARRGEYRLLLARHRKGRLYVKRTDHRWKSPRQGIPALTVQAVSVYYCASKRAAPVANIDVLIVQAVSEHPACSAGKSGACV